MDACHPGRALRRKFVCGNPCHVSYEREAHFLEVETQVFFPKMMSSVGGLR